MIALLKQRDTIVKRIISLVGLLLLSSSALAAGNPPANVSELSAALDNAIKPCTVVASKAMMDDRQSTVDRQLADIAAGQKMHQDASLYRIGHGERETTQHYAELLQRKADDQTRMIEEGSKKTADGMEAIKSCVASAKATGKALFAQFRAGRHSKAVKDDAVSMVTAWLVNADTISMTQPAGSENTYNEWQRVKARAELTTP